jgi:hypothetical protein
MYAWLWRHLPGPVVVRLLMSLLLIVLIVLGLFTEVFPWAERVLPFLQVTVNQ